MSDFRLLRLVRVPPPRSGASAGGLAGCCRMVNVTATSASTQLDNDILQRPAPASGNVNPGSWGKALVRFHAENNDVWLNFSVAAGTADSTQTNAGTKANIVAHIPVNQERDYELDPTVDKFVNYQSASGLTANLRYELVSLDNNSDNTPNA